MAKLARWRTVTLAVLAALVASFFTVSSANALAELELKIAPVVSGTPNVGSRYASTTGTWSPASVTISFQWLADGVPIPGATYSNYRPSAAELGKRLSTVVTATKPGYADRTAVSNPSAPIRLGKVTVSSTTAIGGGEDARVGVPLQAYSGTGTCCTVTLTFVWLRDGVVIPGATQETYTPVQADIGTRIRLRVTGSAPGYIPTTVTSPPTVPVAAA